MTVDVSRKFQTPKFNTDLSNKAQIFTTTEKSWALPRPPRHPFHIVTLSPWPLTIGGFTLGIAGGLAS